MDTTGIGADGQVQAAVRNKDGEYIIYSFVFRHLHAYSYIPYIYLYIYIRIYVCIYMYILNVSLFYARSKLSARIVI